MRNGVATCRKGIAFTLIELLVILVIILVPTAILVVTAVRQHVWRATCVKNEKQLAAAMLLYAHDNQDRLGFSGWDGGTADLGGPGWLYRITNGAIPDVGPGGAFEKHLKEAYSPGLYYRHISDPKPYLCPADQRSESWKQPSRNNRMSSYVMNGSANGFATVYRSARISDAWNPRGYVFWEADWAGTLRDLTFNDSANSPTTDEGLGGMHGPKGGTVVGLDGSVVPITLKEFARESEATNGPGGKSLAWWSPWSPDGRPAAR